MLEAILALILPGPKTTVMLDNLKRGPIPSYCEADCTISHEGTRYAILKGNVDTFTTYPIACVGTSPLDREIILFDPQNSPLLEKEYNQFVQNDPFSWERLTYTIRGIFSKGPPATFKLAGQSIPLDSFVLYKEGACRHVALATAYFLDRLSLDGKIAKGKSYYVRDVVRTTNGHSGHAWNLFVLEDGSAAWHIDTLWGVIKNIFDKDQFNFVLELYGERVIKSELDKCFKKITG